MTSKFSKFITFMLLGFIVLSTTLVIGSLYEFLSTTMQREYYNELRAGQAEVAIILQDRFNLLEMQLKEASLDNALRVNLMLGVTQQLEERLPQLNPLAASTSFLIQETRTHRLIPDLPEHYQPLKATLEKLSFSSEPQTRKFIALNHTILSLFAYPINRKNERLGTVYAIYDLSRDVPFWERFHKNSLNRRLLVSHAGQLIDLFTYDRVSPQPTLRNLDSQPQFLSAVDPKYGHQSLITLKDFPDLLLAASSTSLNQQKRALFNRLALIGVVNLIAAVLLAFLISHTVSKPLKKLVDQALDISKDPSDRFLSEEGIKYREFRNLTASFNLVLENLQAVRKKEHTAKKYLDIIIDTVADPVLVKDDSHRLQLVNQSYCDLLGFQKQQALGKTSYELFPKDEAEHFHAIDLAVLNTESEIVFEGQVTDAQGEIHIVSTKKRRFINPETGHKAIVGVMRDITDAKALEQELAQHRDHLSELVHARTLELEKANTSLRKEISERNEIESALRTSEEKYRTILENMIEGYYEVDLAGNLIFFNEAFCALVGYSRHELKGANYQGFFDDKSNTSKAIFKTYNHTYITGKPVHGFEHPVHTKDGTTITVATTVALMHDNDGKPVGFRVLARDVTEQRRLETQLQQAQRMEAIGTLAGGVAHDLNNILSGLVSYPELLLIDLAPDSPLSKPILTIKKSGEKAAAIVQDLLTLARRGVAVKEVANLNVIITEYLNSPECSQLRAFHPDVHIETDLDPELLNISGSPLHLAKSIMNLVSNAAEAMPTGGTIRITSTNLYVDRPIHGYDKVQEGDYVVIEVRDSGIGIAPKDQLKIFEPFYTKKVMGRSGTGLGMAVVWGAVKDHDGYIDVQSDANRGSTFTLYFPVTRQKLHLKTTPPALRDYLGQGESILVVDDVAEQRDISSGILTRLGYSVTAVASGEEAVAFLQNNPVDLVVLDMIMDPGVDGLETFKRMLKLDPRVKAVIASGFSETDRVREALQLGAGPYIKKPYTMEKIGVAIKKRLRQPYDGTGLPVA